MDNSLNSIQADGIQAVVDNAAERMQVEAADTDIAQRVCMVSRELALHAQFSALEVVLLARMQSLQP